MNYSRKISSFVILNGNSTNQRPKSYCSNFSLFQNINNKAAFQSNEKRFQWQKRNSSNTDITGNHIKCPMLRKSSSCKWDEFINKSNDKERSLVSFCNEKHLQNSKSMRVLNPSKSFDQERVQGIKVDYYCKLRSSASGSINNLLNVTPTLKFKVGHKSAYITNDIFNKNEFEISRNTKIEEKKSKITKSHYAGNTRRKDNNEFKVQVINKKHYGFLLRDNLNVQESFNHNLKIAKPLNKLSSHNSNATKTLNSSTFNGKNTNNGKNDFSCSTTLNSKQLSRSLQKEKILEKNISIFSLQIPHSFYQDSRVNYYKEISRPKS